MCICEAVGMIDSVFPTNHFRHQERVFGYFEFWWFFSFSPCDFEIWASCTSLTVPSLLYNLKRIHYTSKTSEVNLPLLLTQHRDLPNSSYTTRHNFVA